MSPLRTLDAQVNAPGRGLCFGDGLRPEGERVEFDLSSDRLRLWPGTPRERTVAYGAIRLEPGGFERRHFQLTWGDHGPWVLVVDDDDLARRIRSHPPPGLEAEVRRLDARLRRGGVASGVGWSVVGAVVLAPFLLLALLWWQADRVVGAAVERIPIAWEVKLGDSAFRQLTAGAAVLTAGEAVEAVDLVAGRLTNYVESPYTFKWHVVDDPQINAFAVPGGHIVVFTGLLRTTDTPEELAGVLAHELQHVVLRHSLHGLVRSLGWGATIRILFGSAGPLSGVGELAAQLGSLKFNRDQETAADVEGIRLLHRAHVDPQGMITFFDKLASRESGIALLSTHPMSTDRAARLRAEIANVGPWTIEPLPIGWAAVRAALEAGGQP